MALVGLLKACLGDWQYVPAELHLDSTIEAPADRTERRRSLKSPKVTMINPSEGFTSSLNSHGLAYIKKSTLNDRCGLWWGPVEESIKGALLINVYELG